MYKKQRYDGHSNPNWTWSNPKYNVNLTFEEKMELFINESKDKLKGMKQEFVSNNQEGKMAERNAKYRSDKNKKDRGY